MKHPRFFTVCALLAILLSVATKGLAGDIDAYRASLLHFKTSDKPEGFEPVYFPDGLLLVQDGKILSAEPFSEKRFQAIPERNRTSYPHSLIMPGFIDTHIHYPQTEMIAAYGEQLLSWLNQYTFPTEKQYSNRAYADKQARFFINELLRNGTTSALVFGTVHPESVEAIFTAAEANNMRLIAGKVMMDRHAPDYLLDTPESAYRDSKALIEKWHGKGRLLYAVTPRFAPTSTPEQLTQAGRLMAEFPDVYLHTHLSENLDEIAWVKSLFPEHKGYLDVYDSFGLTGDKSVFAHAVHLTDAEFDRMAKTDSVIAFCPTSNLFLGSGLFPLSKAEKEGIRVGLGTDVGAGTSFSMFETLNEAYKVQQLQREKLSAYKGLYMATLGGAKALSISDKVGNFEPLKEADFIVVDLAATPLQQLRLEKSATIEEKLFYLLMLGDDRNIKATYIAGEKSYENTARQ